MNLVLRPLEEALTGDEASLLSPEDVHVWFGRTDECEKAPGLVEERVSARAIPSGPTILRSGLVVRRSLLRFLLSRYAGIPPGSISLRYGSWGKPTLERGSGLANLKFSASSSGSLAVYAVTMGKEVGVDLEPVRSFPDMGKFVDRYFSVHEKRAFKAAGSGRLFFDIWTAKESFLKGTGEGLSTDLREISIVPAHSACSRIRVFSDGAWKEAPWMCYRLGLGQDVAACLAISNELEPALGVLANPPAQGLLPTPRYANPAFRTARGENRLRPSTSAARILTSFDSSSKSRCLNSS